MRCSSRFLIKIILVLLIVCLTYLSYNIYFNNENPLMSQRIVFQEPPRIIIEKRPLKPTEIILPKRVPDAGLKLFQNVEDRFEDMYNFKMDLQYLRTKKPKRIVFPKHEIEIWGKASIAEYLWNHILDANSTTYASGLIKHGEVTIENLHFQFRSGPGIVQNTVPTNVKNLVLVLNGKDEIKIKFSKYWLDYLAHYKNLKNVALVLLGDEKCNNDWIIPYLKTRGGVVDIVFLTYDCKLVDNKEFFQWPLGVATYRGFPNLKMHHINAEVARQHLCSFLGTVYKNSSREVLHNILKNTNECFVASRDTWVPVETYESMSRYIKKLTDSELTLNPVGQNTECYRIYEALSLGAVPVVENVVTPGNCDSKRNAPLRLLKQYNAPLVLIDNWNDLNLVLEVERKVSIESRIERRKKILKWYEGFKWKMRSRFVSIIKELFFKES